MCVNSLHVTIREISYSLMERSLADSMSITAEAIRTRYLQFSRAVKPKTKFLPQWSKSKDRMRLPIGKPSSILCFTAVIGLGGGVC
jgi:hypothetical protein